MPGGWGSSWLQCELVVLFSCLSNSLRAVEITCIAYLLETSEGERSRHVLGNPAVRCETMFLLIARKTFPLISVELRSK